MRTSKGYAEVVMDVMLHGRYVTQVRFEHPIGFLLTEEKVRRKVEEKKPGLKGKDYNVVFVKL